MTGSGTLDVAYRILSTLLAQKDAKSSAVWLDVVDVVGGRSSTLTFDQSSLLSCLFSATADDQQDVYLAWNSARCLSN